MYRAINFIMVETEKCQSHKAKSRMNRLKHQNILPVTNNHVSKFKNERGYI